MEPPWKPIDIMIAQTIIRYKELPEKMPNIMLNA